MPVQVITVHSDGKISGLQVKKGRGLDLRSFGPAKIVRASEIVWDEDNQAWAVEIMDAPGPGGLGGTYGGSPIGVAAGNAVLDVIEEEGLCERAERLGARLKQRLQSLVGEIPQIADIRGPGFMNAVEFNLPGARTPNPDFANKVREKALDKGLILLTCGVYGNVIRFLAPITIEDEVFGEALDILEETLRECAAEA